MVKKNSVIQYIPGIQQNHNWINTVFSFITICVLFPDFEKGSLKICPVIVLLKFILAFFLTIYVFGYIYICRAHLSSAVYRMLKLSTDTGNSRIVDNCDILILTRVNKLYDLNICSPS